VNLNLVYNEEEIEVIKKLEKHYDMKIPRLEKLDELIKAVQESRSMTHE